MVVEVTDMSSLSTFLAVVVIVSSAGCGGAREAGDTTSTPSTTGSPTTAITVVGTTTLPVTTEPAATSVAPTTSAVSPKGASSLRSILELYERAAMVESKGFWQAFEFDRCWRVSPSGRDAGDPVVQQDVVARGDVFDCYLHTDPPADVLNDFYVIVLDDAGTAWANGAGTDGSFYLPAVPSGLLCREYLTRAEFVSSMGDHSPEDPAQVSWWIDNEWAYASVLAYWFMDGQRADMDVDHDRIPCELLFDPATVARVWAGNQP